MVMAFSGCVKTLWRGVGKSLVGAFVLLLFDVVCSGSFLLSFMICPIWFLVCVVKNAIQRPGWGLALIRVAIPAVVLVAVLQNDVLQRRIANENAQKVIAACEEFHSGNGRYPKTLQELVPKYLSSVPRAKYCTGFGDFWYFNNAEDEPFLFWHVVPPYGRKTYDFKDQRWGYLD